MNGQPEQVINETKTWRLCYWKFVQYISSSIMLLQEDN
jgi:hypothetical protein